MGRRVLLPPGAAAWEMTQPRRQRLNERMLAEHMRRYRTPYENMGKWVKGDIEGFSMAGEHEMRSQCASRMMLPIPMVRSIPVHPIHYSK